MKKKITTLILLLLAAFICMGQNYNFNNLQTHRDYKGKVYEWEQINNQCYNCASFYIKIMKTTTKDNYGYYNYHILFYSNSYDSYGYLTNTYLDGVNLYVTRAGQGFIIVDSRNYILVPPKTASYDGIYTAFIFNSTYANEKFKITWNSVSIY